MKYAIDGSNVLLGLRLHRKASTRLFARLVLALVERGDTVRVFFDASIERHMTAAGLGQDWLALKGALAASGTVPTFSPRADTNIETYCEGEKAAVLNSSDKMDSWRNRPGTIHRALAYRNRGTLRIAVLDDANGKFVFTVPAHEPFELGGLSFSSLRDDAAALDPLIAADTEGATADAEGTLLVLALDASGSMATTDTFDGRPKTAHLNDTVKQAIARLKASRTSEALFIAILRFENDVTPLPGVGGGTFSSVHDLHASLADFDYLKGVSLGMTNIRLALQRSKELIQNTLADEESTSRLAHSWRAAVVLVTDGNHVVQRPDGSRETDDDVATQALDIHQGLTGLINSRIDVGCVGIGTDINRDLLKNIASRCTPLQKGMAARAGISHLLLEERLFVVIDANDVRSSDAIRAFIDVASASA